jgi:hypothetical protein
MLPIPPLLLLIAIDIWLAVLPRMPVVLWQLEPVQLAIYKAWPSSPLLAPVSPDGGGGNAEPEPQLWWSSPSSS